MRKSLMILLALTMVTSAALAVNSLQVKTGELNAPPSMPWFDTFNDTIKYDNNQIAYWYGGLTNFLLATKFTPLSTFELEKVMFAMADSSSTPITVQLKSDSSGFPGGAPLWTGTLAYNTPYTWRDIVIDTTGGYMFAPSSNFWLTIFSAGPPWEIYDSPPSAGRSKTYDPDQLGGWVNSPGDNFIRAVGTYSGGIVDVGVDSIWNGQNFHLVNPGTFTVGCKVKNYGTAPASFNVACSLFTEVSGPGIVGYSALTPQAVLLAPGATANVTFPAANVNVNNRYRIRARSLLTGDVFADNDIKDTETQIYTTSAAELRYDDLVYHGAAYNSTAGSGWGLKFNPHQGGNYTIYQIKVMTDFAAGNLAARVQLLDDNGVGGAPGTVLWETVQVMAANWNRFYPNVSGQTGSFYIAYSFENGASTSALRFDDQPSPNSGMGWDKTGGVWTADPNNFDWMMRATILTGTSPTVWVSLTPQGTTAFPPSGGVLNYRISAGNTGATVATVDVWANVMAPDASVGSPVLGPLRNFVMPSSPWSTYRDRSLTIQPSAPAGQYALNAYLGVYSSTTKYSEDHMAFSKAAASEGDYLRGWDDAMIVDNGEPFTFADEVASVPEIYNLAQNFPNPFNPSTGIQFSLPQAGVVKLTVYNVAGSLVATLVDGYREAGVHQVTFDASELPSGVYLYKLTAGNYTGVNKMVLMK